MGLKEYELFANITIGSCLIPLALGIWNFKKLPLELKLLLCLIGVSITCDILSYFSPQLKISSNYAGTAYELVEFILLSAIYKAALKMERFSGVFSIVQVSYFLLLIINLIFFQQGGINSYIFIVSGLIFTILPVIYFYRLMIDLPTRQVSRLPMFWVNTGILIYFASTLFLFTLSHYLVHTMKDDMIVYWSFHNLVTIGKNLIFAIGFYVSIRSGT